MALQTELPAHLLRCTRSQNAFCPCATGPVAGELKALGHDSISFRWCTIASLIPIAETITFATLHSTSKICQRQMVGLRGFGRLRSTRLIVLRLATSLYICRFRNTRLSIIRLKFIRFQVNGVR